MPKNTTLPEGFTVRQPEQSDNRTFIPPGSLDLNQAGIPGTFDLGMAALPGSVTLAALAAAIQQALFPAGAIMEFAAGAAPTGFLVCDGSSLSTTTYANLFAAIGYQWGGAGASFNLPDARGRTSIGAGTGAGLSARTVGQSLGEENHLLIVGEIPGHTHNVSGNTGGFSADHTHNYAHDPDITFAAGGNGPAVSAGILTNNATTTGQSGNHSHAFSATTDNGTPGGGVHNNMQPSIVFNKVIKY